MHAPLTTRAAPALLSDEELRSFREEGFVIVPGVFRRDEVASMAAGFDRLWAIAETLSGPTTVAGSDFVVERVENRVRIDRVVWCGGAVPTLLRWGADRRLVSLAAQVLEASSLDQIIHQAHFKQPGDEVAFDWHQDAMHRRYGTPAWDDLDGRGSFVEIATAIDDMGPDNGPLQVIPRSHRGGYIPVDPTDRSLPPDAFDPAAAVDVVVPAGGVVLFGPFVIHGSQPNRSARPRRLFLNGFAIAGANHRAYPGCGTGRRLTVRRAAAAKTQRPGGPPRRDAPPGHRSDDDRERA